MSKEPSDTEKAAAGPGAGPNSAADSEAKTVPRVEGASGAGAPPAFSSGDEPGTLRRLAPPPKPAARSDPENAPLKRSPVITIGESSPPPPAAREAQAWVRPNSEPPGSRSNPPPAVAEIPSAPPVADGAAATPARRASQPGDLRSKLGLNRPSGDSVPPPGSKPPPFARSARTTRSASSPPPPEAAPAAPATSAEDAAKALAALERTEPVAPAAAPPAPELASAPTIEISPDSETTPVISSDPATVPLQPQAAPAAVAPAPAVPAPAAPALAPIVESEPPAAIMTPPPSSEPKEIDAETIPPAPPPPAPSSRDQRAPGTVSAPAAPVREQPVALATVSGGPPPPPRRDGPSSNSGPAAPIVASAPAPAAPAAATAASEPSSSGPPTPARKSEPARLRGGPPRPRASSPGFTASRPPASPPRPSKDAGTSARAESEAGLPGPPRVPNFPLNAGAPRRQSSPPPPRRSDPVVPASAIAVMKIVAVGDPEHEPPELDDDAYEQTEPGLSSKTREAKSGKVDDLEEIAADEVSTLVTGQGASGAAAKGPITEEIPIVTDEDEAEPPPPPRVPASAAQAEVKPPPPPVRKPRTPSLPKPVPHAKRRQKAPWWEEVFSEDFVRASPSRPTDDQIRREVDFIEESLGVANGGVVLDLGCGAGHHAVELTSRGYGVVGYDLSLYQLALAADTAQERGQKLNFLQGDMREMAFEEMFDGVFSWNTSFGYFEEEKNQLVAERVFRALRPGGMFLLDVVNRDFVAACSPSQLWYEGDSCVCMDDMNLDFITSRLKVKRSVILDDGRTRECTYSVRVYSLHELGKVLHDVGFRVTEASGHPSTPGVFFGEHSPRIIILAQKP